MSCCCTKTKVIGCVGSGCDTMINTGILAVEAGTYVMTFDNLGVQQSISKEFAEDEELSFPVSELPSGYYIIQILNPDGDILKDEDDYDCFSFKLGAGWSSTPAEAPGNNQVINDSYLSLTDTDDTDYVGKFGRVPMVAPAELSLLLGDISPSSNKISVFAGSTGNIAGVYSGGGVGATLTVPLAADIATFDTIPLNIGQDVILKDQINKIENGLYLKTSATVLTRLAAADSAAELDQLIVFIINGLPNGNKLTWWAQIVPLPDVGADDVIFQKGLGTAPTTGSRLKNVLFVDPQGNDAGALKGNLSRAWKTIKAAITAAENNGDDIIWVMPGTYAEGELNKGSDNVEKRGIIFYFMPGAIVNTTSRIFQINLATPAGKITVRGSGRFLSTQHFYNQASGGAPAIDFDSEFDSIESGTAGDCCAPKVGTFRLKGRLVKSQRQYCITPRETAICWWDIDVMEHPSNPVGAAIYFKDYATDGVERVNYSRVGKIISNANNFFGAISSSNAPGLVLMHYGDIEHKLTEPFAFIGSGIVIDSGKLFYYGNIKMKNDATFGTVNGLIAINNGHIELHGSIINEGATRLAAYCDSNSEIIVNGTIISNNPAAVVQVGNAGIMQIRGCVKNINPAAAAVALIGGTGKFYFNNTLLINKNAAGKAIVGSGVETDIYLIDVWSNVSNDLLGVIPNSLNIGAWVDDFTV